MGDPEAVSYSGPTYVAKRSGKHNTYNDTTHFTDFKRMLELEEFKYFVKVDNNTKPISVLSNYYFGSEIDIVLGIIYSMLRFNIFVGVICRNNYCS